MGEPYSRSIQNRMARVAGHLTRVKRMIDEGEDYTRVVMQLSAVRSSLASLTNELLLDQMDQALHDVREQDNTQRLDEVYHSIRKYYSR